MSTRPLPDHLFVRLEPDTGGVVGFGYHVHVLEGPDAGLTRPIQGVLTVGTHASADLRLTDGTVSRFHCELRAEENGVRMRDLGSSNGTFVSGARAPELLIPRDTSFTVGTTVLRVTCEVAPLESEGEQLPESLGLVGASPAWRAVVRVLERVGPTETTVLLRGETGVGKERVARALHALSARAKGPFEVMDCRTLSPELVESELFGHAQGAFTGATADRAGAFVRAHGGTLFLDGVGELPLDLQPRLLRALEMREVKPLGGNASVPFSARVIASTEGSLEPEVARGAFRRDLYFRLAVVLVELPPLRSRREDIPVLARQFLRELGQQRELPPAVLESWAERRWEGNVRELRNAVSRWLAGEPPFELGSTRLTPGRAHPKKGVTFKEAKEQLVQDFTREYLEALLERHDGNVGAAAQEAGLARTYLYTLMKKLGL